MTIFKDLNKLIFPLFVFAVLLLPSQALAQSPDPSPSPSASPSPSTSPSPSPSTTPSPTPSPSSSPTATPTPATGGPDKKEKVLGASTTSLGQTGNERDLILFSIVLIVGISTLVFGIKTVRNQTEE